MSGVAAPSSCPATNDGTDIATIFDTMSYGPAPEAKNVVEVRTVFFTCLLQNRHRKYRISKRVYVLQVHCS